MTKPHRISPRELALFGLLCAGVGCAGPSASLTTQAPESSEETCMAQHKPTGSDQDATTTCRSQQTWLQKFGNALNGVASALRMPNN